MQYSDEKGRQAIRAIGQEVVARFDSWAQGEIKRLEKRAQKAEDHGYPSLATGLRDRAGLVKAVLDKIKDPFFFESLPNV